MPGRQPLFLDACLRGAVVEGLLRRGWDAVRAVDLHGEGARDPPLFEHAASLGRVFVTNDGPLHRIAVEWLRVGRPFRMIYWSKNDDQGYSVGQILDAFEELAREDDPFRYPIYLPEAQGLTGDNRPSQRAPWGASACAAVITATSARSCTEQPRSSPSTTGDGSAARASLTASFARCCAATLG